MIFRNDTNPMILREADASGKSEVVQARYDIPNAASNPPTVQKVEIVGINYAGMGTDKGYLPVKLYGRASTSNSSENYEVKYPLLVKKRPVR